MSDETALEKVEPVPPMVLARDLAASAPREFVHVDRKGRVRSPARYHAIQAVTYGAFAMTAGYLAIVYGAMFGVLGVAGVAALGLPIGFNILRLRKVQRAARLLMHDRVEEALLLLETMQRRRTPRVIRAMVEQNVASCHSRRGRYAEALVHEREAIALHARGRRGPLATIVEYAELNTLVNLDRVAEAREVLGRRHPVVPEADYLRVLHWSAELYVCLGEGKHALPADELHARTRVALGITSAAILLGLLAWAHHVAGDDDQAWHLLREAEDRRAGVPIEVTLPRLHAWMAAHRDAAISAGDPFAAL